MPISLIILIASISLIVTIGLVFWIMSKFGAKIVATLQEVVTNTQQDSKNLHAEMKSYHEVISEFTKSVKIESEDLRQAMFKQLALITENKGNIRELHTRVAKHDEILKTIKIRNNKRKSA